MKGLLILLFGIVAGAFGTYMYSMSKGINVLGKQSMEEIQDEASAEANEAQARADALSEELGLSKEENTKLQQELETQSTQNEDRQKRIEALEKEFQAYREEYKLSMRNRARGMKLATFQSGLTRLTDVEIVQVEGKFVRVRHAGGEGRYEISTLKPDLQKQLGAELPVE